MCLFRPLAKSTVQGVQLAASALEVRIVFVAGFPVAADVIISLVTTASPITSYEAATEPTSSLRLHFQRLGPWTRALELPHSSHLMRFFISTLPPYAPCQRVRAAGESLTGRFRSDAPFLG
jgi:hypothetical protein